MPEPPAKGKMIVGRLRGEMSDTGKVDFRIAGGLALLVAAGLLHGCRSSGGGSAGKAVEFYVNWPLDDPAKVDRPAKYLLKGELSVRPEDMGTAKGRLVISLTLSRPHDEQARKFWNTRTLFPQYAWMGRVRVWDERHEWLWPNLAYLFKLHGRDREQRYGGWDPGHKVDNDFGAVLIRKYDAAGVTEHPDTKDAGPLVSANWHTPGVDNAGKHTVVHLIKSDDFTVHLADKGGPAKGVLKVWFVYGDFMRAPVPKSWPSQKECDGGTIAFFRVAWDCEPGQPLKLTITQEAPVPTGFDWSYWIGREDKAMAPLAEPKLTDADN